MGVDLVYATFQKMVAIANAVFRDSMLTVSTSGSSRLPACQRAWSNCRNSGPSNHLDSISFVTVQPLEIWSEGLRCVGTCLQRQAVVSSWTSEMRLLTNVDNVAECWRIQCNTICKSHHKYVVGFLFAKANKCAPHNSNLGIENFLVGATRDLAVLLLYHLRARAYMQQP